MILGHELTHGFDNTGRLFDKDGRINLWWTPKAVRAFQEEAQCFVDQYSNYAMFGTNVRFIYTLVI